MNSVGGKPAGLRRDVSPAEPRVKRHRGPARPCLRRLEAKGTTLAKIPAPHTREPAGQRGTRQSRPAPPPPPRHPAACRPTVPASGRLRARGEAGRLPPARRRGETLRVTKRRGAPLGGGRDGTGRAPCCLRGGRGGQPAVSQRRHLQPGGSPSLRAVLQGARPRVQPRSAADMKQSKPNKEGRGGRRPPKQPPNPPMFNAGRPDPTDRRSPLRPSRGRPLPVRPPEAAEEEEEEMEGWRDGAGESGPSLPACRSLARQTRLPSAVE